MGTVTIGYRGKEKEKPVFFVHNTGISIPRAQQKRVFQKFFRADNAFMARSEGTGLGLYIAYSIVRAHGGQMWFDSAQKKGTTFYFTLNKNNNK